MKTKQFLLVFGIFSTFAALSQPEINFDAMTPSVGDSFTSTNATFIEPGEGGANQVWDYSQLEALDSYTMTFESPEDKPGSNLFPNATHLSISDDGTIFKYWSFAESRINRLGLVIPSEDIETVYVNPFLELQFPLSMNASFEDDWIYETNIGDDSRTQQLGSSIATVDGFGTLITPAGNYTDVLRIKYVIESEMIIFIEGIEIFRGPWSETSYSFFKSGIPNPLASFRTTNFNGRTTREADYLSDYILGISDFNNGFAALNVYPNPANDYVEIAFQIETFNKVAATLFSLDGRPVHEWNVQNLVAGKNKLRFDLPNVAEGIYLLQLKSSAGTRTEKIVIHH